MADSKLNGTVAHIIEALVIAAITGLVIMYGTVSSVSTELKIMGNQVNGLGIKIDNVQKMVVDHIMDK